MFLVDFNQKKSSFLQRSNVFGFSNDTKNSFIDNKNAVLQYRFVTQTLDDKKSWPVVIVVYCSVAVVVRHSSIVGGSVRKGGVVLR